MVKKLNTQTIFNYFVNSFLVILCICVSSYSLDYIRTDHPIKRDLVGKGVIEEMTKDLYGTKYTVKFPKEAPITVTKEVYYQYEVGDKITLYRDNEADADWVGFKTFVISIIGCISLAFLVMQLIHVLGIIRSFIDWGCHHSNTKTFKGYLLERKNK